MIINKNIVKNRTPDKSKEKRFAYDMGKKNIRASKAELICKFCSSIYEEKHWKSIEKLNPKFIDQMKKTVCPACHAGKGLISDGTLHVTGSFMNQHRQEILNIILNTETREINRDILNRIERIDTRPNEITVYTGKNMLAVEIGKKISDAYKGGKLEIKWSKKDKPVEVKWHKDIDIAGKNDKTKKIINKPKKK